MRQAVIVARELEPLVGDLRRTLDLREPFRDPGVGEFGLENAVFALEDCFLEVIAPTRAGTAGGRYLERHGDGGYMIIFDVRELAAARERAAGMGIRVVWQIDLPDISGTHLHPADMGGAIVSIDRSEPEGSWRWGGPEWTGRRGCGAPLKIVSATFADPQPEALAGRWAEVLGVPAGVTGGEAVLALDGAEVRFREQQAGSRPGLVELSLEREPGSSAELGSAELGGVRFSLRDES